MNKQVFWILINSALKPYNIDNVLLVQIQNIPHISQEYFLQATNYYSFHLLCNNKKHLHKFYKTYFHDIKSSLPQTNHSSKNGNFLTQILHGYSKTARAILSNKSNLISKDKSQNLYFLILPCIAFELVYINVSWLYKKCQNVENYP